LDSIGLTICEKIADHYFTGIIIKENGKKADPLHEDTQNKTQQTRRNDKKIVEELINFNWEYLKNISCPNVMYEEITSKIEKIYENCTKEIKHNEQKSDKKFVKKKNWISQDCIKLIKQKNKLWKKIKNLKTVNQQRIKEYNELKQKVSKLIKNEKQQYFTMIINSNKQDKSLMWKTINKLTGKHQQNIDEQLVKTFKGSDMQEIRNKLNENFVTQTKKLKGLYKRPNHVTPSKAHTQSFRKETFFMYPPEKKEIIKILKESKSTNVLGIDEFLMDN